LEYTVDKAIAIFERTPSVLRFLLDGLDDEWVHGNYGDKTFSPFDVVGHLIHGEKTDWIPRARIILEHGESQPFEPFDRFAMYEASEGKTISELLDEFAALRAANIKHLQELQLSPAHLSMRGTHPELGSVTLASHLSTWVVHDLNHIAQICRALSHQYTDAVGPWKDYLAIISRWT